MRHLSIASLLFLTSFTTVACGGAPFDSFPGDADGAEGDAGGAETSTVVVGPPDATTSADSGDHPDATTDSSNDVAMDQPDGSPDDASGVSTTCDAASCDGGCAAPDTVHGVFVSASSTATTGCGSISEPCGTIAAGIMVAKTRGLTIMYLDAGTYPEQVPLISGLTIEGGWLYEGNGIWNVVCGDPSAVAIIRPTSIASGPAASVLADGVTATLSTLTVKSLPTAAAGQTLYGVFAWNGASLTLNAVEVSVAAGGAGTPGTSGPAPAGPQPPCAASNGEAATVAGANGGTSSPTYSSAGYTPGNGAPGSPGESGNDGNGGGPGACVMAVCGSAAGAPTCTTGTCASPDAGPTSGNGPSCGCSAEGTSGCGGPGGSAGTGGGGGGGSFALYAWNASASVTGGSLTAHNAGNGGAGGGAGAAPSTWANSAGAVGASASYNECGVKCLPPNPCTDVCEYSGEGTVQGGTAGGPGGAGSSGGIGGSGSGGDSYAYYAIGDGGVTVSGTALSCGSPGISPGPIAGVSGTNGSGTCHTNL